MNTLRKLNPSGLGPSQGLYSQVVEVPHLGLAWVSGQVSIDSQGEFVGLDDPELQTTQILRNIEVALDHFGQGWDDVVKLTTYLTASEDYAAFARARKEFFRTRFREPSNYPAHTLLVVSALSAAHHRVELEAIIRTGDTADA